MAQRSRVDMLPACDACPLIEGKAYKNLAPAKIKSLFALNPARSISHHTIIHTAGNTMKEIYSLESGWAYGFILLPDGRRQILSFYLPGDIIDLQGLFGDPLWFSVQSLTDVVLCAFDRPLLQRAVERDEIMRENIRAVSVASVANRDFRLVDLGRKRAIERIAALVQEIASRYSRLNELDTESSFPFLLRHEHLADALGLTRVHVSRVLAELRMKGVVEFAEGRINILDPAALQRLAGTPVACRQTEGGLFVS